MKYPILSELRDERSRLPDIKALRRFLTSPEESSSFRTSFLDAVESLWNSQLELWDQSYNGLQQAAINLPAEARGFTQTALSFFNVSNEGYIGEIATQRHVTVLADSFILWIADYRAAVDDCAAKLRESLGRFRMLYATMVPVTRTLSSSNSLPGDQFSQLFQPFTVQRCSDNLKPIVRNYLRARLGPAETLGPFGAAAAWLLRTESPELALIIGLLGFGFFGALATSFIREFAGTPGNELPPIGFIVPALIRGIGAAILVFLLAKGGMAIFTRGDATPNPYAIFFACFVAAVFSEDVWSWARTRQGSQFARGDAAINRRSSDRQQREPGDRIGPD